MEFFSVAKGYILYVISIHFSILSPSARLAPQLGNMCEGLFPPSFLEMVHDRPYMSRPNNEGALKKRISGSEQSRRVSSTSSLSARLVEITFFYSLVTQKVGGLNHSVHFLVKMCLCVPHGIVGRSVVVVVSFHGFVIVAGTDPDEPSPVVACDDLANFASHRVSSSARKRGTQPTHSQRHTTDALPQHQSGIFKSIE